MITLVDYTKATGGVIHTQALIRWMTEAGHHVRLLSPNTGEPAEATVVVRDCLIQTPSWRQFGIPPMFDSVLQLPTLIREIFRFRPDVLYIRNNTLTPILNLTGRVFRVPVFVEHNSWQSLERAYSGTRRRDRLGLEHKLQVLDARLASHNRAVTVGIRDLLLEAGVPEKRVSVIGNGADTEAFYSIDRKESLARWDLNPDLIYLGFIGSLTPWHGVHVAISAMRQLVVEYPETRLLIFGDGPDRDRLVSLAHEEGIEGHVLFMGQVPLREANAAISCFDIAFAPFSRLLYEKVGVATVKLGDYAAAGRPVVGSDLPGIREMAKYGWVALVPPDDPPALASGIGALLADSDKRRRYAIAGRQAAEGALSWRVITQQVIDLLSLGRY